MPSRSPVLKVAHFTYLSLVASGDHFLWLLRRSSAVLDLERVVIGLVVVTQNLAQLRADVGFRVCGRNTVSVSLAQVS